jgi:drug/metabolite transporter (DMT)-like permease
MAPATKAYLQIHLAVILFGFTAILGDLITLSALNLVWWRVMITSFSLLFFLKRETIYQVFANKTYRPLAGIGVLVGLHWIFFYGAVKLSNATITLVCMATTSTFTAIVEPLILKTRFKWVELLLGALLLPCILLIINQIPSGHFMGVVSGLAAALLAAVFAVLNKKYIRSTDSYTLTFVELSSAFLFLSAVLVILIPGGYFDDNVLWPENPSQWFYMALLSLGCTTLAYVLSMKALNHISAYASNMVINLEPVYGILLAIIILEEHKELNHNFYIGAFMIGLIVFTYPFIISKMQRRNHGLDA